MSRFLDSVKKFLSKNYWIQPVLLVAVIFGLVFSIQGISNLVANISDSLSGKDKCNECVDISYEQLEAKIDTATDEKPVIVLITTDECSDCVAVYEKLDVFLRANPQYKVFRIEIQENEDKTAVGKEVYDDETLTKTKLDDLKLKIYDWLKYEDDTDLNNKPSADTVNDFSITAPTLVMFGSEKENTENDQIFRVLEKVLTTSNSGKDDTISTLYKFFDGVNDSQGGTTFPWWGWALSIGGGVAIIFAVILFIRKRKK